MEDNSAVERNIVSEPYGRRQFIVVIDDAVFKKGSQPLAREAQNPTGVRRALEIGASLIIPATAAIAVAVVQELVQRLDKLEEQGTDVLPISQTEALKLRFPIGHPRADVLYVGHPALPDVYYTTAQFHRLVFEHKFTEAIQLLMSLGANSIRVEHVTGWSQEFSSRLGVGLPVAAVEGSVEAGRQANHASQMLFQASLPGNTEPQLPENLVWFHHEPTWQGIADGRLKYGLLDFELIVSYQDDFGVNAGLKVKASKVGLDLGGQFEDHQSTVWRISGKFAPSR